MRVFHVDVGTREVKEVAKGAFWEIRNYVWSPDSKWISYSKPEENGLSNVYLYSLEKDKSWPATDGWHDSYRPEFSGDGKYLFFISERDFNPIFSGTEWNHAYADMARVYFVTLAKDTPSPFRPKDDSFS
jgi:tricorn protease